MQPKNVTFPTDAKLLNRARERLVRLAKKMGVTLRQSYARVGKLALIKHQRYAHAKQFKRANEALRKLKTYLGRVIRDIRRKIAGDARLRAGRFADLLQPRPPRARASSAAQRGPKVYSLHAPEVECIGKGKPHKPYEFGVKVSVATTLKRSQGRPVRRPCARRCRAILTTATPSANVIPAIEQLVGNTLERIVDRCRLSRPQRAARLPLQGLHRRPEARASPTQIKREMRRRSAVEPVIGHLKAEHRMGRNYLAHTEAATPSTPSSPPSDTTSASSSGG